jgi:hypothetical protein
MSVDSLIKRLSNKREQTVLIQAVTGWLCENYWTNKVIITHLKQWDMEVDL